ncbi:MAG: hypothetical protein SOX14_09300 [Ruminococcus callidus]|nr:hypothetical protein [Ruminococcus callidus]
MPTITNFGTMNYTVGGQNETLSSNTISTDLNVSYNSNMVKGASQSEFAPGDTVTYQIRTTNTGTGTFYNLSLSDNLGSATTVKPLAYVENSVSAFLYNGAGTLVSSPAVTVSADENGNAVFSVAGSVPEGYVLVLTYDATVNSTLETTVTSVTNTATFNANEGGVTGAAYSNTASTTINRETVTIVKSANAASVTPGDDLVYTFTLTNIGTNEVSVSSLTDQLPANFTTENAITVTIGANTVTYLKDTDFTVSDSNNLVIAPAAASTPLTIPAATGETAGVTTISIPGTVSA